jgi:hypothetical protein
MSLGNRSRVGPAVLVVMMICGPALAASPADPPKLARVDLSGLSREAARSGLRAEVLRSALEARDRAVARGLINRPLLTVIDYSLPSRERRLWVLDLAHSRVVARELVAHGRGSGDDRARRFSNRPGSFQSSLGTFVTGSVYQGRHGIALRLRGLDPGVNDRAEARAIVVHGAPYVSQEVAARLGRVGRSQGCPALSVEAAARVIELIRDGTVVYAYYSPRRATVRHGGRLPRVFPTH